MDVRLWHSSFGSAGAKRRPESECSSDQQSLSRLHFFLSATSEAPEVNLYGKPRIAIWPINNDFVTNTQSPYTTPLDRMIAHASSLKIGASSADRYYFTRADSTSPTNDYANIPRNQQLFQYLQTLASTPVPGYGGTFTGKYQSDETNQILTEIFDYIRSTNVNDPALMSPDYSTTNPVSNPRPDYSYAKYRTEFAEYDGATQIWYEHPGIGQVTPISIPSYNTKGFGRFYSISEVGIDFTREQVPASPPPSATQIPIVGSLYLGLYSPSLGPGNLEPDMRIVVNGLESLTVSDGSSSQQIFGPLTNGRTVYSSVPTAVRWHAGSSHPFLWGGATGPRELFALKNSTYSDTGAAQTGNYGFCGNLLKVNSSGKLSFSGGQLTISIYHSDLPNGPNPTGKTIYDGTPGNASYLVQQLTVSIPPYSSLPLPANDASTYSLSHRLSYANYDDGDAGGTADSLHAISQADTVRSVVGAYNGDLRLIAGQSVVPSSAFVKHVSFDATNACVHSFRDPTPHLLDSTSTPNAAYIANGFIPTGQLVSAASYNVNTQPLTGLVTSSASTGTPDSTGDWDNGLAVMPDGPYINKPDEVNTQYFTYQGYPYYTNGDTGDFTTGQTYSSPNRIVASPVVFGSLPTGVPVNAAPAVPWRTLLFRPQLNHFGETSPKDSLLLDWFWMPVVEPYAISTTIATAGKVNLNYQIAPFTYIKRATALMGVLGSEYVLAVPTTSGQIYKSSGSSVPPYRFPVKVLETDNQTIADTDGALRQFQAQFNLGKIFTSASDICDIYLVPTGQSWLQTSDAENFWAAQKLTGDNSRERPYNGLYSRLTTKSNTFTVHVRAQALKGSINNSPTIWTETPSAILSEYRGSVIINRYLDPEDTNIPDFASSASSNQSIDQYYKYRVLESRRFLP